ncbi:glycoside hydrolase family 2 protein [Paenibacillus sp. B2(2019)]|uniref:glycoside hydrolase family 2 protein n=1 Tax=Paenibacillus sp. B2(2019) TaxID=2607754 RepID=UPI0011F3D0A7|nr:glycoside hydrolase family 2 TIM barrel-domain containing protein [Paenibacillus sp. B2(2019)]KAA1189278.1 glycoside hydrolase family 2 protein [Paenibacillus sp. B2(2019)]
MKYTNLGRNTLNFNKDWKFILGDTSGAELKKMTDDEWECVCLPHTPRLESLHVDLHYQGFCWYRKCFIADEAWKGMKLFIEFEAAMHEAHVWINGTFKQIHKGGYLPFMLDITENVEFGVENVIAVRLDNSDNGAIPPGKPLESLDFSYFGGLYRNVKLHITEKLHVTDAVFAGKQAGGGVFVKYSNVSKAAATVEVQTHVLNEHDHVKDVTVVTSILDKQGRLVGTTESLIESVSAGGEHTFEQMITLTSPQLWHPDHPYLYTLLTEIIDGEGIMADHLRTRIGIRTISFSKLNGFMINGERMVIRGTNRHQQYPYIGNAASNNAQYRDALKLKEGGFNFVRLGHYPQAPAFLDACDELGLMTVEAVPGWQYCQVGEFQEIAKQNIRDMIRRDRNHPCMIMWEVSLNETYNKRQGATDEFFHECHLIAHEEYPGDQMNTSGDTIGRDNPAYVNFDVPFTIWEDSTMSRPLEDVLTDKGGFDREYGDYEFGGHESTSRVPRGAGEKKLLLQAWNYQWSLNRNRSNSWSLGDASWIGIDHNRGCYPWLAECGALDTFRLPKYVYYFYQSQRKPDVIHEQIDSGPMAFIANEWTERVSPAKIVVYSNCDEVELLVNGKSVGIRKPDQGPDTEYGERITGYEVDYWLTDEEQHKWKEGTMESRTDSGSLMVSTYDGGNCRNLERAPFTFEGVAYEPGELKAIGRIRGQEKAVYVVRTPLEPEVLSLRMDMSGKALAADGSDFVFAYAEIRDANGTIITSASHEVTFEVEGPAVIVGDNPIQAEAGIATVLLQSRLVPGEVIVTSYAKGVQSAVTRFTIV